MDNLHLHNFRWPLWRRITFRFFFILFMLQIAPVYWLGIDVPPFNIIESAYATAIDKMVAVANAAVFHVREQLVPLNGSGDTSFSWAQQWFFLTVAAGGCLVWSALDRKRRHYEPADYWLRTFLRYFLILVSFSYGSSKLFALQMPYPSQSMMATRLGDLLPMRLSWAFFGYSTAYQVFGGIMELLVGCLLLYRRTVTAGLLLGFAVYFNVMMLNLSYNIPVKLFSIHYVVYFAYLLAYHYPRLAAFFIRNQAAPPDLLFRPVYAKRWMRVAKTTAKTIFVLIICVASPINAWEEYRMLASQPRPKPFDGLYDVTAFSMNGQLLSPGPGESRRWNDIVFDQGGVGSVGSGDTLFRHRYGRGYFSFTTDTVKRKIVLQKRGDDDELHDICELHYELTDATHARLHALLGSDTLQVEIVKHSRSFPLAENRFQWLSEQPD